MQATETTLVNFLTSTARLIVPLYHRSYRWSPRQWEDFWTRVLQAGSRDSGRRFMGLLYTLEVDEFRTEVVDGMHRLVTTVLLMAALRSALSADTEPHISSLFLLEIPFDKFVLKGADDDTLRRIIGGQPQTAECSRRMFDAYRYFLARARNLDADGRRDICRGLNGLIVLWVALDHKSDDPQEIYLSENS